MKSSLMIGQGRPPAAQAGTCCTQSGSEGEVNLTRAQSWRDGPKQRHREIWLSLPGSQQPSDESRLSITLV